MVGNSTRRKTTSSSGPASSPNTSGAPSLEAMLNGDFGTSGAARVDTRTSDSSSNSRMRQQQGEFVDRALDIQSMTDDERLKERARILEARIEKMREAMPDDRRALGELVSTLNTSFQDLKEGFDKVAGYTGDEQSVMDHAKQAYTDAASALTAAQQDAESAKSKIAWFGIRERAIKKTAQAVADAETAEKAAKAAIDQAEATAQKMRDERLQGADFEASFNFIQACVEQTKRAIAVRLANLTTQADEAQKTKVDAYQSQQKSATNMEKAQAQVDELSARFQQESAERDQLPAGSSERVQADEKVSATQREYEQAKANHDQQLAIYQEMEAAVKALEIQEAALRTGLHAHKVELARLTAGSQVWVVEARNRIAQIKSLASQQASKDLVEVEVATRRDNVRGAAEFAIASLDMITEQAERHPQILADLEVYGHSMADGMQGYIDRWKAVTDKTRGVTTDGSSTTQ